MIWVAGHGGPHGVQKPPDGDFDGQGFRNFAATLERAGGKLSDIVTMTVFIIDARYGDRFVALKKETFPAGNYPASVLVTIARFTHSAMMVEIQCLAVVSE